MPVGEKIQEENNGTNKTNYKKYEMNHVVIAEPNHAVRGCCRFKTQVPVKTITAKGCTKNKCQEINAGLRMQKKEAGMPGHKNSATGNKEVTVNKKIKKSAGEGHY